MGKLESGNRVALVTGSTKGLGWAIAKIFAKNGLNVIVTGRDGEELNERLAELKSSYPEQKFWAQKADIGSKKGVRNLADFVMDTVGKLDVLINNAGIFYPGEVLQEDDGNLEKMIETNLYSAYYLTRALVEKLKLSPRGHIVNTCSVASFFAYPNGGSYSISKFALLGFTRVLSEELKKSNVGVTAVMPGAAWSNSWAGVDLPYERLMEADDVAQVVLTAVMMGKSAVIEDIILRPQLGDL